MATKEEDQHRQDVAGARHRGVHFVLVEEAADLLGGHAEEGLTPVGSSVREVVE